MPLEEHGIVTALVELMKDCDPEEGICLLILEVLICAASGNLACSKKQRYWTPRTSFPRPPFLTEAAILHGESDAGKLLKIFARSITGGRVREFLYQFLRVNF